MIVVGILDFLQGLLKNKEKIANACFMGISHHSNTICRLYYDGWILLVKTIRLSGEKHRLGDKFDLLLHYVDVDRNNIRSREANFPTNNNACTN